MHYIAYFEQNSLNGGWYNPLEHVKVLFDISLTTYEIIKNKNK